MIKNKELFDIYYNYLVEENEKYNLTSITKYEEVINKHFLDSLEMENVYDFDKDVSICDVGSGAGFPGIPLKIEHSNINLTIIEPTTKRINFLDNLVKKLNLSNVILVNDRAENASSYRETFDVTCARAVASIPILLELLVPLTKVNGKILLYKGDKGLAELEESTTALKELNCTVEKTYEYDLPDDMGKRVLIVINKNSKTNLKYPRRYSIIKHNPL